MCKFWQANYRNLYSAKFLHYINRAQNSLKKYSKYLFDDFSKTKNISDVIGEVYPYFWIVTDYEENYMGFVFLDNFIGNAEKSYSAEMTLCFDKCAWGTFLKYSAKIFLKKCFDELNIEKIKVQIYPDNHRTKTLMKNSGFEYESLLKKETVRFGKVQDIEVYALYKSYYYSKK